MKRILSLLLAVILILATTGCSSYYDLADESTAPFHFGYSTRLNKAFVAVYLWDGTEEALTITIPEQYEQLPITDLGGYVGRGYPCPFSVTFSDKAEEALHPNATNWWCSWAHDMLRTECQRDNSTVEYVRFNIHLNKNVTKLTNIQLNKYYVCRYEQDGIKQSTVYIMTFSFTVDEQNTAFYAKDGKLYQKKDDTLVTHIHYPDFDPDTYLQNEPEDN